MIELPPWRIIVSEITTATDTSCLEGRNSFFAVANQITALLLRHGGCNTTRNEDHLHTRYPEGGGGGSRVGEAEAERERGGGGGWVTWEVG